MRNGDLPPSLVTVTGCGSPSARRLVGTSSMGTRWFADSVGIVSVGIDWGTFTGAIVAWNSWTSIRGWNARADHQAHHDLPVQAAGRLRRAPDDAASTRRP